MNSEKKREQNVKEALDFFKKEGLSETIDKFITSEDFNKLVSENYQKLQEEVEKIQLKVPETFKKEAVEYWGKQHYTEELYKTDIKDSVIVKVWATCQYIKNIFKEHYIKEIMIDVVCKNLKEEIENVCIEVRELCLSTYFTWIYSKYIPEDILKEVMAFGNLMIIPIVIMPDETE